MNYNQIKVKYIHIEMERRLLQSMGSSSLASSVPPPRSAAASAVHHAYISHRLLNMLV
jgi:hypothetical protein